MKFPVDLLADVSQTELERLAHNYMNNLLYSNPDSPEHLALSDSTQVTIAVSSVGFVPLYGSGDKQKVLALFSPSDPLTAVALYLLDRWWAVDDILKTADPARGGAVEVETVGERIVLYILNRVVYRAKEMSSEELPFLCHGEKDNAKILWSNGEAVGFYSVKPSGSLISPFSTRSYQLPVMDSIFVRKCQRGKGFGLQMLEDFVRSFKEDCLGLKYPITKFMFKVCGKYLCQYPGDTDLLWEVDSIGGPNQRTNIARKIQTMDQSAVSKSQPFTEESLVITERTEPDAVMKAITTQIKEAGSMQCTVEIVEEVTLLSATREAEVPLTARGRSSGSKRRKMGEKIGEDKSEKVIRIEDIEAETPSKDQVSAQQKTELHVSELVKTEGISSVAPGEQGEHMLDRPATVLVQQDLQEDDVTLAPTTEEPQIEDNAPQNLNSISCDSQITVENVASEIEEECQKEDTAALAVCEEALEEALDKVGEGTQVGVTDEKSEERVTQQELSLSTHATSENGDAGKTGRADVKAATTVESITPRRRSMRHSKQAEEVKQGTTAQKTGVILRGRTIRNTPPHTHKYTRCSQKVSEELEKELDEVAEEEDVSTTQVVEESDGTEGEAQEEEQTSIEEDVVTVEELSEEKQQLEDEQLKNEENMEKQQEPVDEQEAEIGEEEPAVTTRTLRRGRVSTTDTPKGKSKRSRKQIQEETQKGEEESKCVEETGVGEEDEEKTDEEIEEIVDKVKEDASENEEDLELEIDDVEEGEAVAEQKQDAVEDKTGLVSEPLTEGDEGKAPEEDEIEVENEEVVTVEGGKGEFEEGTMMLTEEAENTAVVSAAADDLVQEETDAPLPSPATDSAVLPPVEDEATPSAEEQQCKETATQLSDIRRVTVVLVDLQKTHHDVQGETAATEEGLPVQKTAAEAEEEQREETMKEEETVAQETVPGSSVGIETPELEKVTVKEERCEYKVEAVTKQETEEGREEETAEAVEATPRTRGRPRKKAAPKMKEVVPIVEIRVLRAGRKSYYARQRPKRTHKQLQEEDEEEEEGGEDSTAVEARETEEEEQEQQMTDRKKGEKLEERDATEQAENIEAEMASAKEDIVAEQAVNQHDAQEEGQIDCTETVADVDTDASFGQHDDEEHTLVVAEEALAKQDTVEGEQSTSTSEVVESVQETMLTAKVEQAKDVSEEEVPVVERVLRTGEKTVRATKKHDDEQEEEAPGENSTEEDEPAVEIRILRKGRKPADATPRRKSKRARTQCQTEEEREEEATPAEEIEGEEEEAGQESPEEKDKDVEEEGARNAAGEEPTVGDAEQTKDASTEEAGGLEEEVNSVESVDGIGTDTVLPSSADEEDTAVVEQPTAVAEVGSDTATAEGEDLVEDTSVVAADEAPAVTASKQKASPSTPSPRSRRQKDDSPRRSARKRPKVCYRENNEGERDETEGNTDEEVKVTVAPDEDQGNEKAEPSSDTDEEVEAAGSSQEDEEYEQNTSEEEEEPIVIGKRVLRGRSVPSVIITPQSQSRRRSAKVSNEERGPRSAQKRKSTEVTRKSKHLSRV
ncbi:hypothetical protein VZT92_019587 [Zoarces viviparus]|uniref:Uncharacterized protein n=1 Tax=Zoarces viviparus TaxID=48416 RepID=A0AAW1EM28_ZOAVI